MKPTAFIYGRVSSDKQTIGTSIEIQTDLKKAKQIASEHGCELSELITVDEGVSGFSGSNLKTGKLKDLLEIVKRNDLIILRALDRFSRGSLYKVNSIFTDLLHKGVRFYTTMDNKLYGGESSNKVVDAIVSVIGFNSAFEESSKKSALNNDYILKRITQFNDGIRGLNNAPLHHGKSIPFHCQLVGEDKSKVVVKHPKNFDVAKEIIALALNGSGLHKIIRVVNEKHNISRTKQWLKDYLKSHTLYGNCILKVQDRTQKVIYDGFGETYPKKEYILNGYYPAVCTKNEWLGLQEARKRSFKLRSEGQKYYSLLSGRQRLYCSCGKPLTVIYGKNASQPIYYGCIDQISCRNLEQIYVLNHVIADAVTGDIYKKDTDKNSKNSEIESNKLNGEITELQESINNMLKLVEDHPLAYGDKFAPKIIESKKAIEKKLKLLDEVNGQQFINSRTTEEREMITHEIRKIKDQLLNGTSEQNLKNGNKIYKIIKRITLDKNGLISIEFESGEFKVCYFPIQNKSKGRRMGSFLHIFNNTEDSLYSSMKQDPEFSLVTFTREELENKNHVIHIDKINPSLLKLFSHERTIMACDKAVSHINNYVKSYGYFILKSSFAIDSGLTEKQWQKHKSYCTAFFEKRGMIYKVEFITKNNGRNSISIISDKVYTVEDIHGILWKNIKNYKQLIVLS